MYRLILSSSFSLTQGTASSRLQCFGDPPPSLLNTFQGRSILGWGEPGGGGQGLRGEGGVRWLPPAQ